MQNYYIPIRKIAEATGKTDLEVFIEVQKKLFEEGYCWRGDLRGYLLCRLPSDNLIVFAYRDRNLAYARAGFFEQYGKEDYTDFVEISFKTMVSFDLEFKPAVNLNGSYTADQLKEILKTLDGEYQ